MNLPFEESIASRKKLFCETHPYFRRDVKRKRRRGGRGQEEGYSRQQR